jgi:hypothetical protein
MSTRIEETRRQRIEAAARTVWPDCDPYATSGHKGGYLYADVEGERVVVSWQQDGPSAMPEVRLIWRANLGSLRRVCEDVAEIHRLLTEGEP